MVAKRCRNLSLLALLLVPLQADVRGCVCDVGQPDTLTARICGLCVVAERQPLEPAFFTIRDASPNKPDRWLALPRFHGQSPQELSAMTAEQRTRYWTVAIAKANQVWGDAWGIAVNSLERRSQCHMHMHIGKLKSGAEDGQFVVVSGPGEIPLPRPNDGIWIHPVLGKFHAHWGDSGPELKLEP